MMRAEGTPDRLGRIRMAIILLSGILTILGIFFVHSATTDGEPFPSRSARGQIFKAAVALCAFFVVTHLNYRLLDRYGYAIYACLCLVLAGMFLVKVAGGGMRSFIQLYKTQIQPSELMKVAFVLALARYLRFREDQRKVTGLMKPALIMLLPMGLVLLQPDLGTSLMFPPMLVGMLFVAGSRPRHLTLAILLCAVSIPAAYFLGEKVPFLREYQHDRIKAFFQRDAVTARTEGFHLHQSQIAMGSGGLTGKGFGKGTQNTLDYLPEKHTDFIFSVIGEEFGFVGAAGVVGLFFILVVLILKVAVLTREPFGRLAATGVAVGLAAQSLENIGMTIGLTPITGIPLPFVSLGGSSLVTTFLGIGVVCGIAGTHVRVVATPDLDPVHPDGPPVLVQGKAAGLLENRWSV